MPLTELSIIIVNYRSWQYLEACLDSLVDEHQLPPANWQLVIVDNASGDDQLDLFKVKYPKLTWIENHDNHGFAHGCNLGARAAVGEQLLFLNPDTQDPGQQIQNLLEAKQQNPQIAILSSTQTDQEGQPQKVFDVFPKAWNLLGVIRSLQRRISLNKTNNADFRQVPWVSGSVLMISQVHYQQLNGWCEDFWMYSEDVDICRRATDLELKVAISTQTTVVHYHGGASRRNPETTARSKTEVIISRHLYASKHFPPPMAWLNHIQLIIFRLFPRILALPFGLFSQNLKTHQLMVYQLWAYYRLVLKSKDWRSPRAVSRNQPTLSQV